MNRSRFGLVAGAAALAASLLLSLTECQKTTCESGFSRVCTCTTGATGAQVCDDSTQEFGPCECTGSGSGSGSGGGVGSSGGVGANGCPSGMVYVTGGSYLFSETSQTTTVADFCLDVTEVTVSAYQACVQSGSCTSANTQEYWPGGITRADACNTGVSGTDDDPINCVSWTQAVAYCSYVGGRMPMETEWEWAERNGSSATSYPWGSAAPDSTLACWDANSGGQTCAVGSYPAGDTTNGIEDMGGNVWEMTATTNSTTYVSRGGGFWDSTGSDMVTTATNTPTQISVGYQLEDSGFRCAANAPTVSSSSSGGTSSGSSSGGTSSGSSSGGTGSGPTTIITGLGDIAGIVVEGSTLYYAFWPGSGGGIYSLPVAGGTPTLIAPASSPALMASDGTNLYWAEWSGQDVLSIPLGGGTPTTIAKSQTNNPYVGVALSNGNIYWTSPLEGTVFMKSLSSSSVTGTAIATGQNNCAGLALSGSTLFFPLTTGSEVMEMSLPSGTPTPVVTGTELAYGIATDGVSLYFTDETAGTLNKVAIGGGSPTAIVTGESRPDGVALDSTYVYWTTNGEGAIRKMPK